MLGFSTGLPKVAKRSGAAAAKSGTRAEVALHAVAVTRLFANGPPAGTKDGVDVPIRLWLCSCGIARVVGTACGCGSQLYEDISTGVENKNSKSTVEAYGRKCIVRDGQITTDDPFYSQYLPNPIYAGIPSAISGVDKSEETWRLEKSKFPGLYVDIPGTNHVSDYYRAKGCAYIQTRSGLYHTGTDVFNFGVPKFEVSCRIRVRPKQHTGSSVPQDVQMCLNFNVKKAVSSPFTLSTVPVAGSPPLTIS